MTGVRSIGFGMVAVLALLPLGGCASPGLPPGGPERHTPPMITRIQPDTNSVGVRGKEMVVHFDEVISEHPSGATSLNDLVLISPRKGAPEVDWHRSSISIRPRKGWRPNTAYTVTILPGISDLRGNIRPTSTVVTFSTGSTIPPTILGGTLFDWLTGIPVNTGMVEARPVTDTSTVYVAASDSIGHYRMRGLPAGQYMVRGFMDQNRNRAIDPGEAFDTTRVYLSDTLNLELLAFAHDSTGPHLSSVTVSDSMKLHANFDTPLDPRVPLEPAQFRLIGPDSTQIAIVSATAARQDTTRATPILAPVSQSAIPIPQRRPEATRVPLPRPTRPLLIRDVQLVLATPLRAGSAYRLDALNAVGPTGHKLSSSVSFTAPKRVPAKTPIPARPMVPAARPAQRPAR